MRVVLSKKFIKEYRKLTPKTRTKVDRLIEDLPQEVTQLKHSGIQVKKMVNSAGIYEARVDLHYRVTFQKQGSLLILRRVGTHEIYRKP